MATKKTAVTEIKRKMPDMLGVKGELVELTSELQRLHWGSKRLGSPYDAQLRELEAAGQGKVLRFGEIKARVSVIVRAKKLGLKVTCAEDKGVLYVRFDGHASDDMKATRREQILSALKFGPSTPMKLAAMLRDKGDAHADGAIVELILAQSARTGEVVAGEGGVYALNPRVQKRA